MYTYVALTLFDYFHTLSDCNPVWIHGMQVNEMKLKKKNTQCCVGGSIVMHKPLV